MDFAQQEGHKRSFFLGVNIVVSVEFGREREARLLVLGIRRRELTAVYRVWAVVAAANCVVRAHSALTLSVHLGMS